MPIPGQPNSKTPPVFLNHIYLVVDSTTFKAIEQSTFLRGEFAVTEQRTTVRTDRSYTGLYFYGTSTYFEFFDVSSDNSRQVGFSGIAFGVDQTGELQAVGRELTSDFAVDQELITRQYNEQQVPWFYAGKQKDFSFDSSLGVWLMEYHPRFLNEWNPRPNSPTQAVSRKEILQRYAAVLKDVPTRPYFEDVVALTVAVNDEDRQKLSDFCKQLGYSDLSLIPETEGTLGIQEITMRVSSEPKDQTEFRFGPKSMLRFRGDGLATWSF